MPSLSAATPGEAADPADLDAALRRKDEILATLAHELRSPLAPICSAIELLHGESANRASVRAISELLERQVRILVRLVDDMLDMTRVGQGRLVLNREAIDLGTVLGEAIEIARPHARERQHRLQVLISEDLPPLIADRAKLTQVIVNLLNNACKFTERGGCIEIAATAGASAPRSEVRIAVRDNGIGFDEADIDNFFRMFGQGSDPARRTEGLGIGLTLSKALVELHAGRIEAHSAGLGQGSEFVVCLPTGIDAADGAAATIDLQSTTPAATRCSVLVVDDNLDAARSLALLLELAGQEVRTAFSGREALLSSANARPDAIVLAIGMTDLDGYEVARRIRQRDGDYRPRMIALTGWSRSADRELSLRAGFDAHMVKPVNMRDLQLQLFPPPAGTQILTHG